MVETNAAITATFFVSLALMLDIGALLAMLQQNNPQLLSLWQDNQGQLLTLIAIAIVAVSLATAPPAAGIRAGVDRFTKALGSAD